jgi:NAD(P)-dependent dehydrogenase (short-subunit alcohol dehydrogenase family)
MSNPTLVVVGVRNLGRAIALHHARMGWEVVCASRTAGDVEALARDVDAAGGNGVPVVCDLQDPGSLRALVRPRVDLVVAAQTAGGRFGSRPLLEIDDAELESGMNAYVRGTWNLLKALGPTLVAQQHGSFFQMGTSSGVRTKDGFAVLGAVQHGLRALVQVAAREWRAHGVHAAYVAIDGGIDSERTRGFLPADRLIPADEIARSVEYLHAQAPGAWTHELVLKPTGGDWTTPT